MSAVLLASHEGYVGMAPAANALKAGKELLDIIEIGIRPVEDDPSVRTVGLGGAPNMLGEMECDASVMDGQTLRTGSVGALKGFRSPIVVARAVFERLPHVLLVGEGAARFASEIGAEKHSLLSDEAKQAWEMWREKHVPKEVLARWPNVELAPYLESSSKPNLAKGTTTLLLRTKDGRMAGGVSTTGWAYKYPGRLGDSPIIGAGLYVDGRYGGATCTHTGEMTIRGGTARSVVLYMKKGASVKEACHQAMDDLRSLKGGYIGPVIIHGLSASGETYVLSTGNDEDDFYWLWKDGMSECQKLTPCYERL